MKAAGRERARTAATGVASFAISAGARRIVESGGEVWSSINWRSRSGSALLGIGAAPQARGQALG